MIENLRQRVCIADDQPVLLKALKRLMSGSADIVGEAATGEDLLHAVEEQHPDVVVMEHALPGTAGIDAIAALRSRFPKLKLLVLSRGNDVDSARAAFKAGAQGYFFKNGSIEELLRAFQSVMAGDFYLPAEVGGQRSWSDAAPEAGPDFQLVPGRLALS